MCSPFGADSPGSVSVVRGTLQTRFGSLRGRLAWLGVRLGTSIANQDVTRMLSLRVQSIIGAPLAPCMNIRAVSALWDTPVELCVYRADLRPEIHLGQALRADIVATLSCALLGNSFSTY